MNGALDKITPDLVVAAARGWIGTPYRHQASLRGIGTDCLGLVRGVWRDIFGDEPETTPAYDAGWAEAGGDESLIAAAARHLLPVAPEDIQCADVLLFRWRPHLPAKHMAILTEPRRMIHAQDGQAVCEVSLSPWWRRHMACAFRFPGVA